MALLSIANLHYAIGERRLLEGVNLTLDPGQRVGLVGRNGCGKSTLLKLIAGLSGLKPDSGQIQLARGASVGYLTQDPELDPQRTLRDEAAAAFAELAALHQKLDSITHDMAQAEGEQLERLLKRYEQVEHQMQAAGGYAIDHRIDATLHGVGLTDEFFHVKVADLSGGQKGRLALAKLLLSDPDVLLLDEPTNHLDIAARQWLEQYLASCRAAVILVSHDRWLLDRVVDRICELERGQLEEYPGNYAKFRELRDLRRLEQQRLFDKQQDRIKREQTFIDRYRAGQRARQAKGREKRLERFVRDERIDAPVEMSAINLQLGPTARTGDLVATADHVSKQYDDKVLFRDLSLVVKRGDRIGIIGPNGAGKSTFVRCLLGEQQIDGGHVRLGAQVNVGHYRQSHDDLPLSHTVIEYLQPRTPSQTEQQARDLAGAFLFSGDEQDKPLNVLSGGERSRAVLAGLVVGGHNVLVLDEPTNHLDISSAERLEEALRTFTAEQTGYAQNRTGGGTLILITHDRMLLENLVDQLLVFDGHGQVRHFLGTYSELVAAEAQAVSDRSTAVASVDRVKSSRSPGPAPANASDKSSRGKGAKGGKGRGTSTASAHSKLSAEKLEARIVDLETRLADLDRQLADPDLYRDPQKVRKLQELSQRLRSELEPLETEWLRRAE